MSQKMKSAVEKAVELAVKAEIRNPMNSLDAAPGHVEMAATAVAEKVLDNPVIEHLTSSEDWWRSRANWSAIMSGITALSSFQWLFTKVTGIAWVPIPADDLAAYSLMATLISGVVASRLARRARTATKPLGK